MQKEKQEILLSLYEDYREHARHSESTREGINNFILVLLAAILTVIVDYNKNARNEIFGCEDKYLILLLILISFLGLISFFGYTERYHRNKIRAAYIRHYLDELLFINKKKNSDGKSIKTIKKDADQEHYGHLINIFSLGFFRAKIDELKTSLSLIKGLHHIISLLFLIVIFVFGWSLMKISISHCSISDKNNFFELLSNVGVSTARFTTILFITIFLIIPMITKIIGIVIRKLKLLIKDKNRAKNLKELLETDLEDKLNSKVDQLSKQFNIPQSKVRQIILSLVDQTLIPNDEELEHIEDILSVKSWNE